MARKRGNPNWGRTPDGPIPVVKTEFEKALAQFGLEKADEAVIARSRNFQAWARANHRKRYVPENLLQLIGLDVPVDMDL